MEFGLARIFKGWEHVHHQFWIPSHAFVLGYEVALEFANNQLGVTVDEQPPLFHIFSQFEATGSASNSATLFVALNPNLTTQFKFISF